MEPDWGEQHTMNRFDLLINSDSRISNQAPWVPRGPFGVLEIKHRQLVLDADTPSANSLGASFILWPIGATALRHAPYETISVRVSPTTPGVRPQDCEADRHCVMLVTGEDKPRGLVAHFDWRLGDLDPMHYPIPIRMPELSVNVTSPLTFKIAATGQAVLEQGHLKITSHMALMPPWSRLQHWRIDIAPVSKEGQPYLHVNVVDDSKDKASGFSFDMAQKGAVTMPHYCGRHETGWQCVPTDYYPDWAL
jgi:hypothetical protein